MIDRIIQLPPKQSFFLFGPRQSGKSTLIESRFKKSIWKLDLLLSSEFFKYSQHPDLFRTEAEKKIAQNNIHTIFVDEIQRVPILLNEIQSLMSKYKDCQFILTGSSARKLKRGGANLLGGRAIVRYLFPLVYEEMHSLNLDDILRFGTLPAIVEKSNEQKIDILSAYAHVYLKEEIQVEGVVRNVGAFGRFLDMSASQCGELVSFSTISRECYIPVRTVQSYYEILEDTLIGFRLQPWDKGLRKQYKG